MVQRKLTLQPQPLSLSHHHDCTTPRVEHLKTKKMKKSGSIKTPLPNYMKSTTSSEARKEQSHSSSPTKALPKSPAFKPPRSLVVVTKRDAQRATCSSTLKHCKFPTYLSLTESEGASTVKVCPYSYCSLNAHRRHPLPPLKCFLSARRRAVKTQRSMNDDLKSRGFFLEIYSAGADETDQQGVCNAFDEQNQRNEEFDHHFYEQDSDMEWETGYCSPHYDDQCSHETAVSDVENELMLNSDDRDCFYDDNLVDQVSQESFDEEGFVSDTLSTCDDDQSSTLYEDDLQISSNFETSAPLQVLTQQQEEEGAFDEENHNCLPKVDETSEAKRCILSKDNGDNAAETETEDVALLRLTPMSKMVVQDGDELRDFDPRAPNFLPMEPDPEAEKVDLRHQDLDERKNAEEWMVDYALRQVVTKLSPARKKKVSLLIEAFEKVMPATKWDLETRPIQACR